MKAVETKGGGRKESREEEGGEEELEKAIDIN